MFLDIFDQPEHVDHAAERGRARGTRRRFGQFLETYQSGTATDLDAGLTDVDKQINQLIQLGG